MVEKSAKYLPRGYNINPKPANIIESFKILDGNAKVCVMFEPLWGIPYVLYNFYLCLYIRVKVLPTSK